jgi:peptidoglycan/xylan/chitin deacetylase (PgdA/CDA1 family)
MFYRPSNIVLSLIAAVGASACASKPLPSQELATATSGPARYLAQELTLNEHIERLLHGRVSAQSLIAEFDRLLASKQYDGSILQKPIYAKLLAVRSIVDQLEYRLSQRQESAANTEKDAANSAGEKGDAREVSRAILSFRKKMSEMNPRELLQAFQSESAKPQFKRMQAIVEEMSEQIAADLAHEESGRAPQQAALEPSVGAKGNITGNGFPLGTWSLTYDDGPRPVTSIELLEDLKGEGVKATWFMLMQEVLTNKTAAVRIADPAAGMDIASHSWSHPQMTRIGQSAREHEINEAVTRLGTELGRTIKLFRLPYGAGVSVAGIRQRIADAGLIHVFWNVDTLDWQDKNPDSIVKRALNQMAALRRDAGVILFHDIHPQSVKASRLLIAKLKASGKKLCTVQSVVDQLNGTRVDCAQ